MLANAYLLQRYLIQYTCGTEGLTVFTLPRFAINIQ